MPNDSTCQCYHAVAAANLQRVFTQCKYEIIFYEYLIYTNIVNITNILRYENLALYGTWLFYSDCILDWTYVIYVLLVLESK